MDVPQQVSCSATVNSFVFRSNVPQNQRPTGFNLVTPDGKRGVQFRPCDSGCWIPIRCTFQDGCLTFIDYGFNRRLQHSRSREGQARLTFCTFLSWWATRSRGTYITRNPHITFYAFKSCTSYWAVFSRRSFSSRSPRGTLSPSYSWSSSFPTVSFWSWSAEGFIFGTNLVLQRLKLLLDQQFDIGGCLDRSLLWLLKRRAFLSWPGVVFKTLKKMKLTSRGNTDCQQLFTGWGRLYYFGIYETSGVE